MLFRSPAAGRYLYEMLGSRKPLLEIAAHCGRVTGNPSVIRYCKSCRPSIKERRKASILGGIEMFRQLLGNECALLSSFQ